jgi:hypothetical protein
MLVLYVMVNHDVDIELLQGKRHFRRTVYRHALMSSRDYCAARTCKRALSFSKLSPFNGAA